MFWTSINSLFQLQTHTTTLTCVMEYWFKKKQQRNQFHLIYYSIWHLGSEWILGDSDVLPIHGQRYEHSFFQITVIPLLTLKSVCRQPIPMRACTPQTWFHLLISFMGHSVTVELQNSCHLL